jgi:hypothetical protein
MNKDARLIAEAYNKILKENENINPFNEIDAWFRKTYANVKLPDDVAVVDEDIPYQPKYTSKYNRPMYTPAISSDLAYTIGDFVYYPEDQTFVRHFAGNKTKLKTAEEVKSYIANNIEGLTSMSEEEYKDALWNL